MRGTPGGREEYVLREVVGDAEAESGRPGRRGRHARHDRDRIGPVGSFASMRTRPCGSTATRVPDFAPGSTVSSASPAAEPNPLGAISTSSAPPGPG